MSRQLAGGVVTIFLCDDLAAPSGRRCKPIATRPPLLENVLAHLPAMRTQDPLRGITSSGMTTVRSSSSRTTSSFGSIAVHPRNILQYSATCWLSRNLLLFPNLHPQHLSRPSPITNVRLSTSQTRPRISGISCVPSSLETCSSAFHSMSSHNGKS